jgi:TPP-dependent pyruvate/acetoin dehydrogenase alpha subunit
VEVDEWKRRDPLATFAALLRAERLLDDAAWQAMEADVAAEIERAITFADAGPWEPVADLTRDLYTPRASAAAPPRASS